jgi:hypothetical protein
VRRARGRAASRTGAAMKALLALWSATRFREMDNRGPARRLPRYLRVHVPSGTRERARCATCAGPQDSCSPRACGGGCARPRPGRGGGRAGWNRRGRSRPGHLGRLAYADGCTWSSPSSSIAAILGPWLPCQGSRSDRVRLGLDTADSAGTIERRGLHHQPGGSGAVSSLSGMIWPGPEACGLPVPFSRWWRRARPGVLEGMLAIARRCCGSRELQISDSGV